MKIKVVRPFVDSGEVEVRSPGEVIDVPKDKAQRLIDSRLAEVADAAAPVGQPETGTAPPAPETAVQPRPARGAKAGGAKKPAAGKGAGKKKGAKAGG